LTIDPTSQDVYVTDAGNNRVESFTSDGVPVSQFGSAGVGTEDFSSPIGLTIDAKSDDIYVADFNNNDVTKLN
jgi:DNA-binding beta-propeller fold protein YncE